MTKKKTEGILSEDECVERFPKSWKQLMYMESRVAHLLGEFTQADYLYRGKKTYTPKVFEAFKDTEIPALEQLFHCIQALKKAVRAQKIDSIVVIAIGVGIQYPNGFGDRLRLLELKKRAHDNRYRAASGNTNKRQSRIADVAKEYLGLRTRKPTTQIPCTHSEAVNEISQRKNLSARTIQGYIRDAKRLGLVPKKMI